MIERQTGIHRDYNHLTTPSKCTDIRWRSGEIAEEGGVLSS